MKMNLVDCSSIKVFFTLLNFFHFYLSDLHHYMHICKVYLIYFQIWNQLFMGTIFSRTHVSTSWNVQWLFICRWKTRGFEGGPVEIELVVNGIKVDMWSRSHTKLQMLILYIKYFCFILLELLKNSLLIFTLLKSYKWCI